MTIRNLLLAGAVFPFAMGSTGFALDATKLEPAGWVLAQAVDCGDGVTAATAEECPATPEEVLERARRVQQELQGGEQPAEAPAAEAAPAEEPAAETAAEQPAEAPAEEETAEQPAEAPAAEETAEQPVEEEAVETLEAAPEQVAPAEATPEQVAPAEATPEQPRRARREERRRRDGGGAEEPAADTPAAASTPEQPVAEEPVQTQEAAPTEVAPETQQPAVAEPATPEDVLRRARRVQQQLQEQSGQPVEQAAPEQPAAAPQDPAAVAAPQPAAPSVVEQQLEAQGDEEEANQIRALREKMQQERAAAEAADPEAQDDGNQRRRDRDRDRARGDQQADDGDRDRRGRRDRDRGEGRGNVVQDRGDRVIIDLGGGNIFVEPVDEGERLLYGARDVEVEDLPGGRTRTIVYRENGSQIITVRDRRGDIIRRVRVTPNGREVVLIDNRFEDDDEELAPVILFEERDLPPLVIDIPEEEYIVDLGEATDDQVQSALIAPPVQELERQYTLQEVTRNERVRAYVPRIDLDTITFDFGSSTISTSQMRALTDLGQAMEEVLAERPDEVYLIEGHTDAVGSDYDNLILSDRRAEAVAVALSQNFDIPPENLVTEGYGEQYLKVETEAPSRDNRRVSVRRITELLQAENQ